MPILLGSLICLLTKNSLLMGMGYKPAVSSPAPHPWMLTTRTTRCKLAVHPARSCRCTKKTRSLVRNPPWLNLDGEENACGDVQVCLWDMWVWKRAELWAPVVRKLLPFQRLSYKSVCGQNKLIYEWLNKWRERRKSLTEESGWILCLTSFLNVELKVFNSRESLGEWWIHR